MLGIAPGTLRRWADDGRVPVFTTPGGHRRFPREALRGLLPANRTRRPTLSRLGTSPERIARAYRARPGGIPAQARPWVADLPPEAREAFRERGRDLVRLLLEHLDATTRVEAANRLRQAAGLAASYGRESAQLGASLSETVERFLSFRAPFVAELAALARKRGLDTREATALLADAEAATDRLLVGLMTGHTAGSGLVRDHR